MSGRFYTIPITDVAVSAAQDLINITATANMAFKLWKVELGQRTLTTWEAKTIRFIRHPATVTAGSGGTAATIAKQNGGDSAATVTARINDTTAMTSSGTDVVEVQRQWEFLNGFFWIPTKEELIIAPSQGLGINLPTAPSGSMTVSGYALIEELF